MAALHALYRKGRLLTGKEMAISVQYDSFNVARVIILVINRHKNDLYFPPSFRSNAFVN